MKHVHLPLPLNRRCQTRLRTRSSTPARRTLRRHTQLWNLVTHPLKQATLSRSTTTLRIPQSRLPSSKLCRLRARSRCNSESSLLLSGRCEICNLLLSSVQKSFRCLLYTVEQTSLWRSHHRSATKRARMLGLVLCCLPSRSCHDILRLTPTSEPQRTLIRRLRKCTRSPVARRLLWWNHPRRSNNPIRLPRLLDIRILRKQSLLRLPRLFFSLPHQSLVHLVPILWLPGSEDTHFLSSLFINLRVREPADLLFPATDVALYEFLPDLAVEADYLG